MQRFLEKQGFTRCGIVYLKDKVTNEKELKEVLIEYLTKKLINDQISL